MVGKIGHLTLKIICNHNPDSRVYNGPVNDDTLRITTRIRIVKSFYLIILKNVV
jgi:hypothetical protein